MQSFPSLMLQAKNWFDWTGKYRIIQQQFTVFLKDNEDSNPES